MIKNIARIGELEVKVEDQAAHIQRLEGALTATIRARKPAVGNGAAPPPANSQTRRICNDCLQ